MASKNRGPALVFWRRQTPITYAANTKQIVPISRGNMMRYIAFRLTCAPTLTGANNTVANTGLGDEWACVAKLELYINGTTLIFSASGSDLKMLQKEMLGQMPRRQQNLGDGATANPALDSTVIIPFLNPRSLRPMDTLLWTGEMSDFRVEVTFTADQTAINSAATAWTTQPTIEVYTNEQSVPLDAAGNAILPGFYRRVLKIPQQIAGANAAARFQLNTGPIYRGFILNETSGGNESHSVLTNVKVYSGGTQYLDMGAEPLQQIASQLNRISDDEFALSTGIWIQSSGEVSSKRDLRGWRFVDFANDGYMSEAINTDNIGDLFIEYNVTGAATINLFTQELLPIIRGGNVPVAG